MLTAYCCACIVANVVLAFMLTGVLTFACLDLLTFVLTDVITFMVTVVLALWLVLCLHLYWGVWVVFSELRSYKLTKLYLLY